MSFVDAYSIGLLIVSLSFFIVRYLREEPPVMPYLVIACTCTVTNFIGVSGGIGGILLLIAASFLFIGCVFYPQYRGKQKSSGTGDLKARSQDA